MLTIRAAAEPRKRRRRAKVGLALAGGGPVGGIYELGTLLALEEALEGVSFNQLDIYVGVSSGSILASSLANQITTRHLTRIFIKSDSLSSLFDAHYFFRPAVSEYLRRVASLPELLTSSFLRFLSHPLSFGVLESVAGFNSAMPTGLFNNDPIDTFFEETYNKRGRTNDFRKLKHQLYVMAVDLNTGEAVKFGSRGYDHVPISKAIQASTALPGLYPPVQIEDRYYVDGVLRKTLHASAALDDGADIVICINPIVPFDARLAAQQGSEEVNLMDGGLPVVLSQTFRTLIHSRMQTGMEHYQRQYKSADVLLFEPSRDDSEMFFTNVFRFSSRRQFCQHAYQRTRCDLLARRDELEEVFGRHGIRLRTDRLAQPDKVFDAELAEESA